MTALPTYTSDFEKGLNSKTISNCFHKSFTCRPVEINVKTTLRFMRVKSRVKASKSLYNEFANAIPSRSFISVVSI